MIVKSSACADLHNYFGPGARVVLLTGKNYEL